jgi:hypothetical protein
VPLKAYEKVEVLSCPDYPDRVGKFGHILGMGHTDAGEIGNVGVFFDDVGEVYCFDPAEVRGTGEVAERSDFYGEERVRVRVEDGKGFLADE